MRLWTRFSCAAPGRRGRPCRSWKRLTQDPATAGGSTPGAGWRNLLRFRQEWAEDRLVGDDGGVSLGSPGASERLGFVSWFQVDFPAVLLLGAWASRCCRRPAGKGYGTLAHRLLIRYLFAHSTVHRVEAVTEAEGNVAEQRVLEKAGLRPGGA